MNKDYDDNESKTHICDHSSLSGLEVETNGAYFTETYVRKKMEDEDCHYPTICYECKGTVRNKLPASHHYYDDTPNESVAV